MAAPGTARGFSRVVKARQRLSHLIAARVDGTGTAAMLAGGNELTLTDNGTGDYTLTLATPSKKTPVVVATSLTAGVDVRIGTLAAGSVQILGIDTTDGSTAADCDFHVMIMCSDDADEK